MVQEWEKKMCCNIVYTKMEDERTWNLRKNRKWKRRAEEPAGRKPTGFRKKERSGRSGARTQDRPVTCQICSAYSFLAAHAFGIEPDACHITKKRTSRHEAPTDSWKKSEVDALGLEPRTVRLWAGCSDQLS